MILIPAGEFLMGSDAQQDKAARDDEQPQHLLYLPEYYLAKTPVTNAQYRAFVMATGHEPPPGWASMRFRLFMRSIGHEEPPWWTYRNPPGGEEEHPAAGVTWYDARDYCHWLSEVTGRAYHLPSEAEWEKGARGTDGRIYPWGNRWDATRCHLWDHYHLAKTTPVHAYPQGASPYGVLDMAGNVWEWTRNVWGFRYLYRPTDGRESLDAPHDKPRVLRGGSFDGYAWDVRCAHRLPCYPCLRGDHIGFRVVMHP
jgi:formylglycine-generating enzyme required for sulfatase activity